MNKNEILFFGFKPKRSYVSQIDAMLLQWIEWKKPISQESFHYQVKVYKEDGINFYQCEIEATIHGKKWRGFEYGKSVTLAVQSALKHARLQQHISANVSPEVRTA